MTVLPNLRFCGGNAFVFSLTMKYLQRSFLFHLEVYGLVLCWEYNFITQFTICHLKVVFCTLLEGHAHFTIVY